MHRHAIDSWTHDHVFLGENHARNEGRTLLVVAITVAMMIAEIVGGTLFGSMALLADGWHMSTHAAAIGIAAFAYRYARKHARNPRFSFGTGKVGELAAFTSAVVLAIVALGIAYESVLRIANPQAIAYNEAIAIAILGLVVNLACAWLLRDDHDHHHHDDHDHAHHGDNNMRAAYIHVLADAATSVLAIAALLLARSFGWLWIDPLVGIVGACVIASWAIGLMRVSGSVLIDIVPKGNQASAVRERLEVDGDRVCDLHLWQIGPGHQSAVISVVTDDPRPPAFYKARLAGLKSLSHVTVEVVQCQHPKGECIA